MPSFIFRDFIFYGKIALQPISYMKKKMLEAKTPATVLFLYQKRLERGAESNATHRKFKVK